MTQTSEMNKGVQILLERMESNPEEFIPIYHLARADNEYPKKWRPILNAVKYRQEGGVKTHLPYLKDHEVKALWDKMQSILGDNFTKQIMLTLLEDAEPEVEYEYKWMPEKKPVAKTKKKRELSSSSWQADSETQKISLSNVDIMLARKLGLTPSEYAEQKLKFGRKK